MTERSSESGLKSGWNIREGGKGPVDSIELITIQYVGGTADVHSCEEENFTYFR